MIPNGVLLLDFKDEKISTVNSELKELIGVNPREENSPINLDEI